MLNAMRTPLERARQLYTWAKRLSWLVGCALGGALLAGSLVARSWSSWLVWPSLLLTALAISQYVRFCTLAFELWHHHLRMREDKDYHHRCIVEMNTELTTRLVGRRAPAAPEEMKHAIEVAPAHAGAGYAYSDAPRLTFGQ